MQKWEYKVMKLMDGVVVVNEQELNKLGEQGWELVVFNSASYEYVFKRPISN